MEFFLVRIFPHLYWIESDTKYLSVFSPNAEKYEPEKNSAFGQFSCSDSIVLIQYPKFSLTSIFYKFK